MRKIVSVFKWEIKKLFSSWQRTVTLFLLPAIIMMVALNIFPLLVNYMTTGTLNKKPIMVIGAPDSFREYVEDTVNARAFAYDFKSYSEYQVFANDKENFREQIHKGLILCYFQTANSNNDFDQEVRLYYQKLLAGNSNATSDAVIFLGYDAEVLSASTRAQQFRIGVLEKYQSSLVDTLGGDYALIGSTPFTTDAFNPVTDLQDYRTTANTAASRVVPGILLIMMYYCVYSLVSDMFASERDRGFMAKLLMTPVKPEHIYTGKILAINVIVTASTYVTLTLLFFTSWLNRSNDAMSLLPFGMMLTPSELLIVLSVIPITVLLMTALCIVTVFSLRRMQDITVNLQLPLMLFLGDFFLQMFRGTRPVTFEYFIPLHNSLALIAETFMAQNKAWHVIFIYVFNLLIALAVLSATFRKEGSK